MFINIVNQIPSSKKTSDFKKYFQRHIELDGEEHGPLALELISSICGDDTNNWDRACQAAQSAIQSRITLYNEIEKAIALSRIN